MCPLVVRRHFDRMQQISYRLARTIVIHQKAAEIQIRPGVPFTGCVLPSDGGTIGGDSVVYAAQAFIRESQIVFRLDVFWIKLQTLLERSDGFFKPVFV